MKGKGYGHMAWIDNEGKKYSRKLKRKEREEVLANYIRRRSGRKFVVHKIAGLFGVSERTIQKHLADMQSKGWIERQACFKKI